MVELSQRPAGQRGWGELIRHCLERGDKAEHHYLELKETLELPGRIKVAAAKMAKFILGASNRTIEDAASAFGGAAILLVGISKQGDLVGVQEVDSAQWGDSVAKYFGPEKPRWDYQWIRHEGHTLMAITVEPPKQGDPIYRAHSQGEGIDDGDVFIRTDAKTRKATAVEQTRLDQRAKIAPDARLSVGCAAIPSVVDRTQLNKVMAYWANDREYPQPVTGQFGVYTDTRSVQEYRREIREWKERFSTEPPEEALDALAVQYVRDKVGRLSIKNLSDRDLQGVQVTLKLPMGVRALVADDDGDWQVEGAAMPPRKWGELDYGGIVSPSFNATDDVIEVARDGEHLEVVWHLDHLPPEKARTSEEKIGIWTYSDDPPAALDWRVTAAGHNGVLRGTLTFEV